MIPFEKIQQIIKDNIAINANYDKWHEDELMEDYPYEVEIAINDIRLGYIKIREKNNVSGTEGILVPVWILYGQQTNKYKNQEDSSWQLDENNNKVFKDDFMCPFLCINAIDGSIVDLSKGY